jgi:hypothetical protein
LYTDTLILFLHYYLYAQTPLLNYPQLLTKSFQSDPFIIPIIHLLTHTLIISLNSHPYYTSQLIPLSHLSLFSLYYFNLTYHSLISLLNTLLIILLSTLPSYPLSSSPLFLLTPFPHSSHLSNHLYFSLPSKPLITYHLLLILLLFSYTSHYTPLPKSFSSLLISLNPYPEPSYPSNHSYLSFFSSFSLKSLILPLFLTSLLSPLTLLISTFSSHLPLLSFLSIYPSIFKYPSSN